MDGMSSTFSLNPASENADPGLFLSLKLDNQLQLLLENLTSDSGTPIEIEFTSLKEGKIYHGESVFHLKFSDSGVLVSDFL